MFFKKKTMVYKNDDVTIYTGPGKNYVITRNMVGVQGGFLSVDDYKDGFYQLSNRDGWISEDDVMSLADYYTSK